MNCLEEYDWPGNVRDLENAIQSAMILAREEILTLEDMPMRLRGFPEIRENADIENRGLEDYTRDITFKMEKPERGAKGSGCS